MPPRDRPDTAGARSAFEAVLGRVQNPARMVGGEVGVGPGFAGGSDETRVVLAFPDAYEVGISNQAMQILYHVARGVPSIGVERAYLPWVDVIAEMRREGVPLLTWETWTPVVDAHLLAVTLQHELNYTNLLEMLDLAGITLRAADREEGEPLVVVGGPATADFLPVAPFVDVVVLGDGEEVFVEMLGVVSQARREGLDRVAISERLSRLDGCFVPGLSVSVRRRVLPRLEGAAYPVAPLVPLTAGVHDRAWVEVMRGCTRGCRFCQAGMWYRPVRERSGSAVCELASLQLEATGHDEVSLGSLSTSDYTGVAEVLGRFAAEHSDVRVNLPSLRVDSAGVRLAHLTSPTSPSVTLAPEAGSQRLRDVINKNVSEEDIVSAAREAFVTGHTGLKLYFMIGLPTETDADVQAIVELCGRLRALGREVLGVRAGRLQINVSVTTFIPKAFTPFQWVGMADRDTVRRRQDILRQGLKRWRLRLALHDVDWSYLEGALARGGEDLADVIEDAWRNGARFDSWTEARDLRAWEKAFHRSGLSAEARATATIDPGEHLPWDLVQGLVVSRGHLAAEWQRALTATTTGDCRWDGCFSCGACEDTLVPDLADPGPLAAPVAPAARRPRGPGPAEGVTRPHRYLLRYSVSGRAVYLGHLDVVEVLRRTVRRAGGRLALSGGLRPKALLAVALPRAVGVLGREELCEFALVEAAPSDMASRLAEGLPPGFQVLGLERYHHRRPAAARVVGTRYRVLVRASSGPVDALDAVGLADLGRRYTCAAELVVDRERQGRTRAVDVREYVDEVVLKTVTQGLAVSFAARVTPHGTVRPEEVVEVLRRLAGVGLDPVRVERIGIDLD